MTRAFVRSEIVRTMSSISGPVTSWPITASSRGTEDRATCSRSFSFWFSIFVSSWGRKTNVTTASDRAVTAKNRSASRLFSERSPDGIRFIGRGSGSRPRAR